MATTIANARTSDTAEKVDDRTQVRIELHYLHYKTMQHEVHEVFGIDHDLATKIQSIIDTARWRAEKL